MLPILAAGDIDPSEMDPTMIDLMDVVQLPGNMKDDIGKKRGRPPKTHNDKYAAFRGIQNLIVAADRYKRKARVAPYQKKVDSTGFGIDKADAPFEFAAEAMPDIDINNSKRAEAQVDIDAPYGMNGDLMFAEEKPAALEDISLEAADFFALEMDHQPGEKIFAGCDEIELGEKYTGPEILDVNIAQDLAIDLDGDEEITW